MTTDNFQWTDELVKEIVTNALDLMHETTKHDCSDEYIAKFKASKQKPKEWEILEMTNWIGGRLVRPGISDSNYSEKMTYWAGQGYKTITSVRRLSDGEVFTVGDKIEGYKNTGIKKIVLYPHGLRIVTDAHGDGWSCSELPWKIEDCKKIKQPLFTTEDGKPVYEGDSYWYANTAWAVGYIPCPAFENAEEKPYRKYFSTKEAADDYILLNKPMLSVQEVMNRIHAYFGNPIHAFDNIKSFAKSKLQ